jgi:hypothetical protein
MFETNDNFIPLIWEGDQNTSPNYTVRKNQYGVTALPSSMFNGDRPDVGGGSAVLSRYQNIYNQLINVPSPMELNVTMDFTRSEIVLNADVQITESIDSTPSYRIIYIVTNYFTESYNSTVVRYAQEDFELTNVGQTGQFSHSFDLNPNWDIANLRAVVIVQYVNTTGTASVGNYTFNKYPILQAGFAEYPLSAPNPIPNQVLDLNDSTTFDLTSFFQFEGIPVNAELSVVSENDNIVHAELDGTTLILSSFDTSGSSVVTILGSYTGYNAVSSFITTVINSAERYILILDLDPTPTGNTLRTSIQNFYNLPIHIVSNFAMYPLTNADALFILLGIYSNNHQLTSAEAAPVVQYLENGGNVYMEGGDTWAYDPQTALHPYFNINGLSDGNADLVNVIGQGFLAGMNWSYSGGNNYIDRLSPVSPAITIFNSGVYSCGIAYDSGTYKTVGTSFEIAGLGGDYSLNDAVQGILDFFDVIGSQITGTLIGTVYDEFENPLENVRIQVAESFTYSDVSGNYSLELPVGNYTVSATLENYETGLQENVAIHENEITIVNFYMLLQSDAQENVVGLITKLKGNYPNPFNPATTIQFATSKEGYVSIEIFNIKGQKIVGLVDEQMPSGNHTIIWNGKDDNGRSVSSGVYLTSMKTDSYQATHKMILMK